MTAVRTRPNRPLRTAATVVLTLAGALCVLVPDLPLAVLTAGALLVTAPIGSRAPAG